MLEEQETHGLVLGVLLAFQKLQSSKQAAHVRVVQSLLSVIKTQQVPAKLSLTQPDVWFFFFP